ncbi:phage major capsid protein [Glaciimonas sp. PCH181]|uniref:phage major capsid protein n=1 Tax=Glaciimonas sp. PCH181 TaxID=2133943 RepID=UPI000D394F77|nr:phage major capsid protein [Glaciimonas sp. PCH181]PUA17270.1 phage major capsid protein [Glaciimonas sp. PCH181]
MNKRLLQQQKAAAIARAKALNDASALENRDLTAEESTQYEAHMAESRSLDARIQRAEEMSAAEVSEGVTIREGAHITVSENVANDPRGGFSFVGEFMKAVHSATAAQRSGGAVAMDKRLLIGAAAPGAGTYANEGSGADGGFLIPPEFGKEIFQLSLTDNALLPMTDEVNVAGNGMSFPKDETTAWGTNGVRAYWQGEASAPAGTKPVLGLTSLRLKKLMALVPVSDEMLDDSSALASYLPKKIGASIQWKTNEAILFGPGAGLPQGAMVSGAVVTIAKDPGQATNTLTALNLANMIARLPEGSFPNAVWIINNDVLPALFTLTLGNYPIYIPSGGLLGGIQGNPYGTLLGRPIIVSQHANTFSSQGDVMLVDLNYYQTITKAGGVQTATSMHLYFDADATAFRTTFRIDGQSKLAAAISPAKGANKLSPFVQLGAR